MTRRKRMGWGARASCKQELVPTTTTTTTDGRTRRRREGGMNRTSEPARRLISISPHSPSHPNPCISHIYHHRRRQRRSTRGAREAGRERRGRGRRRRDGAQALNSVDRTTTGLPRASHPRPRRHPNTYDHERDATMRASATRRLEQACRASESNRSVS